MDGAEAVCPRTFGGAFATVVVVALEGAIALACLLLFNTTRILALGPFPCVACSRFNSLSHDRQHIRCW